MATSGSIDLAATRDDIIKEALELLGVLPLGEDPSADELASCGRTLNYMVKGWQNRVKHLHAMTTVYLFLDKTSTSYEIDGSTAHATTSYTQTALDSAASSGAGTITVDSITGFSDGDNIGIALADGTRQWTTINGAPSGSTITLTANLTGDANDNASVIGYTTKQGLFHRISQAYERNISTPTSPNDTPVDILDREDYIDLSNKTATGRVNQIYPDYQLADININVWPVSSSVESLIVLKVWRKLEDFDAADNDADFPQNWFEALAYNLALKLAPKYGYPVQERQFLKAEAEMAKEDAEAEESEQGWFLEPDFSGR